MESYEEIIFTLNKPLIPHRPILNTHKIFIKYTSNRYMKYAFELLDTLCQNTKFKNKKYLLHLALSYLIIILFNLKNNSYLSNFDVMILCCFELGIKSLENQKQIPSLQKLKKIYEIKYNDYENKEIIKAELICIKLLNYNINILTYYDCLCYLIQNEIKKINTEYFTVNLRNSTNSVKSKDKILELATKELEKQIIYNLNNHIYKKPLLFAKECIEEIEKKLSFKYPKLFTKKIVPMFRQIKFSNKNTLSNKIMCCNLYKNDKTKNLLNCSLNDKNQIQNNFTNDNNNIEQIHKNSNLAIGSNRTSKFNMYKRQVSYAQKNLIKNNNSKLRGEYSSEDHRKQKKNITRNVTLNCKNFFNSFSNYEMTSNNSPTNNKVINTNYEIASPNGFATRNYFIFRNKNKNGLNLSKNSSSGNIFKKPHLCKQNTIIYYKPIKNKNQEIEKDYNYSNEYMDDAPNKIIANKNNNNFSNTFYFTKANKYNGNSHRIINAYI